MGYPLYVNIDSGSVANSLVRGSGSQASGTASPPEIVLGDKRELDFYFVDASGSYADFSGDSAYSLAIAISFPGGIKSRPSGGDFTLTFGGDTTSTLPYSISASDLETALNGLPSVISAGLLDVTGPDGGPFIITFRTTGDKGTFSADASNLEPRSQVYATTTVEGDGSTQETVVIQLRRTVAAYQNSFTVITDDESNPIGWSGELNASTEGLVELLAGNDTVNAFFEVQVTDPSGNPRTYGQYKCTIRNQIIDPGTVSGPVLEILLTQTQADARYLQIANNLADLDSPSDARTNLGLGSAAIQNTGSSDGDVLQGDGTITDANAAQIIEIDGDGKARASGKSFGATKADAIQSGSGDKVPTLDLLPMMLGNLIQTRLDEFNAAYTGNGEAVDFGYLPASQRYRSNTGGTGTVVLSSKSSAYGYFHNENFGQIVSDKRCLIFFKVGFRTGLGTDSTFRMSLRANPSTASALDGVGVGFLIKNGRQVHGIYHTGTGSEVEVNLGTTLSATGNLSFKTAIEIVGNGTINWYIGGSLAGTASGFTPADTTVGFQIYLDSQASATSDDVQVYPPAFWGGY